MAGGKGVKTFFSFEIDVGADDKAHENYVVAGNNLLYEGTFEIGDGVGKQDRIYFLGGYSIAGKFGKFVDFTA